MYKIYRSRGDALNKTNPFLIVDDYEIAYDTWRKFKSEGYVLMENDEKVLGLLIT